MSPTHLVNEYISQKAKGEFVIAKLVIYNGQKDAITVDSTSFKLIDDKGRIFDVSPEGMTAIEMSNGNADGGLTGQQITLPLQVHNVQ